MGGCRHCGAEHAPESTQCPVTGEAMSAPGLCGSRVDRYEILNLLGMGGFGAVYRARHVHTEQLVALKLLKRQLHADSSMLDRLLREAKTAAAVGSEHIVRVLDASVSDGQAFLVMELLDGWDLKELIARTGPLPLMRAALILVQVLDALSAAHAKGIVHRDLKPANVFLLRVVGDSGVERDFVKLLDFGISKMHSEVPLSSLTLPGMAMGTPAYMAPEQFGNARDVDQRADLYSVAVMAHELFTGRLPFDAESYADLLVKVRTTQPTPLSQLAPSLPPALAAVVDRGLARDAAARWQTAFEFADALRASLGLKRTAQRTPLPQGQHSSRPPAELLDATFTPTPSRWSTDVATPAPRAAPLSAPLSEASLLGATAPPAAAVVQALPVHPAPSAPAAKGSNAWVWVLIGVGIFLSLCFGTCVCANVASEGEVYSSE